MIIALLFAELIKKVYNNLKVYKDIPQEKLVIDFRNLA